MTNGEAIHWIEVNKPSIEMQYYENRPIMVIRKGEFASPFSLEDSVAQNFITMFIAPAIEAIKNA